MKNDLNEQTKKNFEKLIELVKTLRSEEGCDWDKVQTSESLIPYFIEEVYELIDSIDKKDLNNAKEELGDVMLHLVFQAQEFFDWRYINDQIVQKVLRLNCIQFLKRRQLLFQLFSRS